MGRRAGGDVESWGRAIAKAGVVIVASLVGFVVVPNQLLAYLPLHGVTPHMRDALVAAWTLIWFVALAVLFVRLQRPKATA